jgi:hypothetical protein
VGLLPKSRSLAPALTCPSPRPLTCLNPRFSVCLNFCLHPVAVQTRASPDHSRAHITCGSHRPANGRNHKLRMAPKHTTAAAPPPPSTPDPSSSPELDSPSKATQYNKQTGRPIRKSAGKVKKPAGYVDSGMLEEELDYEPLTSDLSEADEEEDMDEHSRPDKTRKRKRSPSPPSPRLEPIIYDQELDDLTDNETSGVFHHNTLKKPPVTLQFNVPLGFHGPLFVKLDSALLRDNDEGARHDMHQSQRKTSRTSSSPLPQTSEVVRHKGFTDLPPELRNSIYRHAFVRKAQFSIPQHSSDAGLCQSAQFLRTCKLVHDEGCSILYGENEFYFSRHHDTRAPFWEPKLKEIGYQDALQFLKMIGPENIQYLRDIRLDFEDAMPKLTPDLSSETRRYLVDDYLMNCLRILRDAKLRKISLMFWTGIKEQMTRKKMLYEKK